MVIFLFSSQVGSATEWYIAKEATAGNTNGLSWANAWTNVDQVVWASIQPGDILWLSGGTTSNVYVGNLSTAAGSANNGTEANPILIKVATNAPQNGLVKIIGTIYIGRNWYIVDGAKSTWTPTTVLDTYHVPTNCNLEVSNTNQDHGITFAAGTGSKVYWLHVSAAGATNDASDHNGIEFNGNSGGSKITSAEIAYCWVENAWGFGIEASGFVSNTWKQLDCHHCLVEKVHDNYMQADGFSDWHHNVFRDWLTPTVGHPDGFQGIANFSRIYNNIVSDQPGTAVYFEINDDLLLTCHDNYIYNNLFYTTDRGTNTVYWHDGITMTGKDAGTNWMTITNVWFFNNTFHNPAGSTVFYWNLGTVRTGGSVSNFHFLNNAIQLNTNSTGPVIAMFTNTYDGNGNVGLTYEPSQVQFEYNSIGGGVLPSGPGIYYGAKGDYFAQSPYTNMTQFGTATGYIHNNNTQAGFVSLNNLDFRIGNDLALKALGTNLVFLTNACPDADKDLIGNSRGSTWDIGAYQSDSSLKLWLTFNDWTGAANATDDSGWTNTSYVYGDATNQPTLLTNAPEGYGAAYFTGNGYCSGEFSDVGQWMGVTNLYSLGWTNDYLTNWTVAFWARYDTNGCVSSVILDAFYEEAAGSNSWKIGHIQSPGNTQFDIVRTDGTHTIPIGWPDSSENHGYASTNWAHYALTVDSTNLITFYNGVQYSSVTNPLTCYKIRSPQHWLAIGCWHHDGTPQKGDDGFPNTGWFTGGLDDLRIYNRTLSSNEVASIFAGGGTTSSSGGAPPEPPASPSNLKAVMSGQFQIQGQVQIR